MREKILNLIKDTSTSLPDDVKSALQSAYEDEKEGSNAKSVLKEILDNIDIARNGSVPICQDTGTANFFIKHPMNVSKRYIEDEIIHAMKDAVREGYLRPNAVDPITGKNDKNGVGNGNPVLHFSEKDDDSITVDLMLKGGGSENVSAQYSLPEIGLDAHRDMKGVKKCVIDAVFKAQGKGCAPGIIGVGIGGDRAGSYMIAKKQLFRKLDDTNENDTLKDMEGELYGLLNGLEIGPMGIGGRTTVLGVKIGALCRVPASFFVSVAYMCWALRRGRITIDSGGIKG